MIFPRSSHSCHRRVDMLQESGHATGEWDRFNNILSVWLSEQTNVVYDPRMVQIVHVDGGHDTVTRACLGRGHGQDTTEFQECYFDDVDGDNYTFAAFITTTRESTDVNARIVRHLKHNTE